MGNGSRIAAWLVLVVPSSLVAASALGACVGGDPQSERSAEASAPDASGAGNDSGPVTDAREDAPAIDASDADAATKKCDPAKPFGAPILVGELSTNATKNQGLTQSPDGKTAYFASLRDGGAGLYDLYAASRVTVTSPFSNIVPIPMVSSPNEDFHAAVSGNAMLLVFMSNRGGAYALWKATRATPSADFSTPVEVGTAVNEGGAYSPFLTEDGNTLYFSSGRATTTDADIWRSVASSGVFGTPSPVTSLNSAFDEDSPVLSPDELVVYWSSNRPTTKGGHDVWVATRGNVGDPFTGLRSVDEVNTTASDYPSFITPDLCTLYIDSENQVLVATKTP